MIDFPYIWAWGPHPDEPWMTQLDRKGKRCKVLARGTMNSALIEFEDGFRTVASRNGLRKAFSATLLSELAQLLAELELVSHVSAARAGSSSRDEGEDVGGRRPPGGIDRGDDREPMHPQKSVEHFQRRLRRARTNAHLSAILEDAQRALEAWKRQPAPSGEPEYGTPQWKRWVAESSLSSSEIARKFSVSGQYIRRIRSLYREAA